MRASSSAIRSRIRSASVSGVRTVAKSVSGTGLPGVQRPKREDDDGDGEGDDGDLGRLADGVVVLGVRIPL